MKNRSIWVELGVMLLLLVACIAAIGNNSREREDAMQQNIAQKVLRFHVVANSDSKEDQEVKLKVRDAVGSYVEPLFAEVTNLEESMQVAKAHLEEIEEIAETVLREEGMDYEASAVVERVEFPDKTYGAFTFPQGEYTALDIKLGSGNGQNWWCLVYPNMCFRGSVYEVRQQEAGELLQEVLSQEEYEAILRSGKYCIRWKFLEYFK